MSDSSEPKPEGQNSIPSLSQDLQKLGQFFLASIKSIELEMLNLFERKRQIEEDPSEARARIEEVARELGEKPREADLEIGRLTGDLVWKIEALKRDRASMIALLDGLKKGEFQGSIDFLNNQLALEGAKQLYISKKKRILQLCRNLVNS